MVNRQDVPYPPGSPEIGRRPLRVEIIFDGTKLPVEPSRPKTTTDGYCCTLEPALLTRRGIVHLARSRGVGYVSAPAGTRFAEANLHDRLHSCICGEIQSHRLGV